MSDRTVAKNIAKKAPDELYNHVLALPKTDKVLLFKNRNFQDSEIIGLNPSRMSPFVCVLDTEGGPKLIHADILEPSLLDVICHHDMPDICCALDTRLKESETKALHLRMGEPRSRVNFGVIGGLIVSILLGETYMDRFITSIHPTDKKIVFSYSLLVPVEMVHETEIAAETA